MKEISKKVKEVIKESIKLEINGRKFFNSAADVTQHESGKKMFRFLADEEAKHMEIFGNLFTKILGNEDWKKFISPHELQGEAPLMTKLKERLKNGKRPGEVEALSIGMELEMSAIQNFEKAALESDDGTAKKIFRDITEEEKFHYDLLQAQYDSVMHTGNWLGSAEFRMDGKW